MSYSFGSHVVFIFDLSQRYLLLWLIPGKGEVHFLVRDLLSPVQESFHLGTGTATFYGHDIPGHFDGFSPKNKTG